MIIKFPWIAQSASNQYIATFIVNILAVIHGSTVGWTSPMIPYFKSDETHLKSGPISASEASWIGSLMSAGALVSILAFGKVAEYFGKKKCLIFLCLPNLTFWVMTYLSTDVIHLYIARVIAGITNGGLLRIVPLYIGEIAESNIRGKLGAYFPLAMYIGIFFVFVLGTYLNFFTIPLVMIPILVLYFFLMFLLPETPQHLLRNHKDGQALKSLKFYRNCNEKDSQNIEIVTAEYEALKTNILNVHKQDVKLKDFVERSSRRGLIMSFFLIFINSFSGNMIILSYTADIFKSSGSSLSANESSMIVASIQFIGIYIASLFVDKFGRKILMSISCLGSGLGLIALASYSYLDTNYGVASSLNWIPIVSLSFTIFLNSVGISSLPFMIVTELVPQKIREVTVMICMALITTFAFVNLKVYPPLVEIINLYGCMYIYAGFCIMGTFVTVFIMPETKGKNLFQSQ